MVGSIRVEINGTTERSVGGKVSAGRGRGVLRQEDKGRKE